MSELDPCILVDGKDYGDNDVDDGCSGNEKTAGAGYYV
jgi:hypothetical protein